MVTLSKIYTKTGDSGQTGLGDGSRISKASMRITAIGAVDETNAAIGIARLDSEGEMDAMLARIQNDLFDLGADICTPVVDSPALGGSRKSASGEPLRVDESYVERLEGWCDEFNAELPKLDSFILPGGTPGAALLHQARTLARRAERSGWALAEADPDGTNRVALRYLNRLSDLLFILCRIANPNGDVLWKPGGER